MSNNLVPPGRPVSLWVPGERLASRHDDPQPGDPQPDEDAPVVGVLALQGDVFEHLRVLRRCGANAVMVRRADELEDIDALVLPGGESTTIGKLLERFALMEPLRGRIGGGMPTFGTCAGMILLSDELDQIEPQPLVGGLPVRTRRNAFGRQVASFDAQIIVDGVRGGPIDVAFIRAPRVEAVLGPAVEVLASVDDHPVVVRNGAILASSFHPEVTGDDRLHQLFVDMVRDALANRREVPTEARDG